MRIFTLLPYLLCYSSISFAQGTDCSSAIPITLNGTLISYSTSSSTGANVLCTNNGTTPITWFSFTTNSSAESPLLNITAADAQPCEIVMYTGCGGNMNNSLETGSSMCFDDGTGLWAPAHNYSLAANSTYYLRIKTSTATNLEIEGKSYFPANNTCSGATAIDPTLLADNNATHKPGQGFSASEVCALTIENTAFYQYYVASNGTTVINISSISCDNGNGNNSSGFQIGFFTGSCSNLVWLEPCSSGSGSFVQATTPVLNAGTKVYVAIDGLAGSNCKYNIQAINAYTLSNDIKSFSALKKANSTLLKWVTSGSPLKSFEIERSNNGNTFRTIGKLNYKETDDEQTEYEFEDTKPDLKAWYRIKQITRNAAVKYSQTIESLRQQLPDQKLYLKMTSNFLIGQFSSEFEDISELLIISSSGQQMVYKNIRSNRGLNYFSNDLSSLPKGIYFIIIKSRNHFMNESFVKLQ